MELQKVQEQEIQVLNKSNPQSMQLINYLASKNDVDLLLFEKNLLIPQAIDGLKLSKMAKNLGEVNTITAICYVINRFNANFNVGKSLTETQSAVLASDIVEKYPYETLEDIVLMLKMVRQGTIGDGKDYKLDGQNVMTKWLPQYLDMKYQEFERQKKKEQDEFNGKNEDNAVSKYYAKLRKEKAEKEKRQKAEKEIDKMTENISREKLEEIISEWSLKDEMKQYLDYLKRKRKTIKN